MQPDIVGELPVPELLSGGNIPYHHMARAIIRFFGILLDGQGGKGFSISCQGDIGKTPLKPFESTYFLGGDPMKLTNGLIAAARDDCLGVRRNNNLLPTPGGFPTPTA